MWATAYVYYKQLVRGRVKELAHAFRKKVFADGRQVKIHPSKSSMRNEELRKGANERDPNAPRLAEESTVEEKDDEESDDGIYFDTIWIAHYCNMNSTSPVGVASASPLSIGWIDGVR